MKKRLLFPCLVTLLVSACSQYNADIEYIRWADYQEKDLATVFEANCDDIKYISIIEGEQEFMFASPDRIKIKNQNIYINDWQNRKLLTFSINGEPISVLNRRGRSDSEYLQISDFDIDDNEDIWVLDGQADCIKHYNKDGEFIKTYSIPFQASAIKCLPNGRLMFTIAQWDKSNYKSNQLILTDSNLNVLEVFAKRRAKRDPNFEIVPSYGLHLYDNNVFYHQPISDDVHCIDANNLSEQVYKFDFGIHTVPKEARIYTEPHIDDFSSYITLAVASYIDDNIIVGGLFDKMQLKSFFINRDAKIRYLQNDSMSSMIMVGISSGYVIYILMPDASEDLTFIPDDIKSSINSGQWVMALLPLDRFIDIN